MEDFGIKIQEPKKKRQMVKYIDDLHDDIVHCYYRNRPICQIVSSSFGKEIIFLEDIKNRIPAEYMQEIYDKSLDKGEFKDA